MNPHPLPCLPIDQNDLLTFYGELLQLVNNLHQNACEGDRKTEHLEQEVAHLKQEVAELKSSLVNLTNHGGGGPPPATPAPPDGGGDGYHSNETLTIWKSESTLQINQHKNLIKLARRDLAALCILAEWLKSPDREPGKQYMPKSLIVEKVIKQHHQWWRNPDDDDIDRVKSRICGKLAKNEFNEKLLEVKRLVGLSIDVPPANIIILD